MSVDLTAHLCILAYCEGLTLVHLFFGLFATIAGQGTQAAEAFSSAAALAVQGSLHYAVR